MDVSGGGDVFRGAAGVYSGPRETINSQGFFFCTCFRPTLTGSSSATLLSILVTTRQKKNHPLSCPFTRIFETACIVSISFKRFSSIVQKRMTRAVGKAAQRNV